MVNVTPSIAASTDTANVVHAVNYNIIRDPVNGRPIIVGLFDFPSLLLSNVC